MPLPDDIFDQSMVPGDPGHAAEHRKIGARLTALSDANLASTIGSVGADLFGPLFSPLEGVEMWATGHSWIDPTIVNSKVRFNEKIANRLSMGTITNRGLGGRTIEDMAFAALSSSVGWVARTKALGLVMCTLNDNTLYQGSAASFRGYSHAWRALLARMTANAVIPATSRAFVFKTIANWTRQAAALVTTAGAGNGSTSGERWTTSTVGEYFEFNVTGDKATVIMVARAAGAGLVTFTVGGTTVGTIDLTATVAQDGPAAAVLTGLGSGTHLVRGTLTSGVSMTVDSLIIPHTTPAPILVLGEPPVTPAVGDSGSYLTNLTAYKAALALVVAEFPSAIWLDLALETGWSIPLMVTSDGKHPNDAGTAWIAAAAIRALMGSLDWNAGMNTLINDAHPTGIGYTPPTAATIPGGGFSGQYPNEDWYDTFSTDTTASYTKYGTATLAIAGGVLKATSGASNTFLVHEQGVSDIDITTVLGAANSDPNALIAGVAARVADASNGIVLQFRQSTSSARYTLGYRSGGTFTQLGLGNVATVPTAGDVVRLLVVGSAWKVYVNGVLEISVVNSIFPTGTKHGLYLHGSDTVTSFDSLDLVAA